MSLPAEVEELIASLKRQIAALQAEVADLRRQLGQDSSNSSKPPSSDGLKKKPRVAGSLRGRSGKASGGQKGHQGGTLRQVADPDHVVGHEASACCHFGAPLICPASIVAWVRNKGEDLRQVYARIGERVAEVKVRHLDETGFRIAGKLQWLHTTSSLAFTFYRAGEKRGAIPQDLQGGVVVHDHFLPYRRLDTVDHAFCNAHILRELQSLIEFDKEPWAEAMRDMLLKANLAVNKAREAGATALASDELAAFVDRYWAAVRRGLAFHRALPKLETKTNPRGRTKQRPGHNLLERLKTFKTETLRFLTDSDVPFTNNLAEQDLRMMKVKMKISGSFRTLDGAQIFARLRSVVSTARKQGCNILQTLAAPPSQVMPTLIA